MELGVGSGVVSAELGVRSWECRVELGVGVGSAEWTCEWELSW